MFRETGACTCYYLDMIFHKLRHVYLSHVSFVNNFRDEKKLKKRQTYIFSATLTLVHSGPQRFIKKKKKMPITQKQKLGKYFN